eukprot:COSAG06_NODE_2681_length_6459_cov_3.199528_3_plen_352_part_00
MLFLGIQYTSICSMHAGCVAGAIEQWRPSAAASQAAHGVAPRHHVGCSLAMTTPRLHPRPVYPSFFGEVLPSTLHSFVRTTAAGTLLVKALEPLFANSVSWALRSGLSDRAMFTGGMVLLHSALYFGVNGVLYSEPEFLRPYRIERSVQQLPSKELLQQTLLSGAVGRILIEPLLVWFLLYELLVQVGGMPAMHSLVGDWSDVAAVLFAARLFNDVAFYWSHRALHHPSLYGRFHKQHHRYTGTIGFAAEHAHPVEQLLSNQIPTVGLCVLVGPHPLVFYVWIMLRLLQTYETHSGVLLPWSQGEATAWHDYHHSHNRGCFGAMWLDQLCGTCDHYLVWKQKQRQKQKQKQ